MRSADLLTQAKSSYAVGARRLGRALTAVGVLGETPPSRDHRLKHWAFSLTRVHDSLAMAELDVPWWTYRAIDITEAWLSARRSPVRVFEYGSGASTLWLSRRADEVFTVEHHRGFAEGMRTAFDARGNSAMQIVEPITSDVVVTPSAKEGHGGLDFTAYVRSIENVPGEFDLIVIDGRAREACLTIALERLAPDGLIVFDNSRRARYRRAIRAAQVQERRLPGLTPTLPYPDQTSLIVR
ncbi:class I SAM-dependent methyltransferase [Aeromicrobium camelliae]|uniref:Class I SAM-dependent methyltransferase n=1 Tax=Aeromicrobium camelliae TaxID=1538144 RepID=A0A3N6X933_9ACTN|nr:class I SAM-dependent methyltransferase [Aeromicrobium camelliae]RQN10118.1 class I SAM-dependent methyltransferase [Aeromicrobium camelliae]